ncbi:MAG: hypothetical protein WB626_06640 [Bacteroidota bacterium]
MKRAAVVMCIPVLLVFLLLDAGCGKREEKKESGPPALTQGEPSPGTALSVAGIRWNVPGRWSEHPPRQMRVATYMVPSPGEGLEAGEVAVFFFGGGQGGDVESNIRRWVGQFENAGEPERSHMEVDGMRVELIELAGVFLAPSGPMMQSSGKKEDYRLMGAIVSAPEGAVFFKFTGPAKTVKAAGEEFRSLIASIQREGAPS